jgi:hypothetical protein
MHPQIAKTLADQRHEELMHAADHHSQERTASAKPSRLSRRLPHWHVSWSRTVLSPAGIPGTAGSSSRRTRSDKRGSSLVIIISAYRSA